MLAAIALCLATTIILKMHLSAGEIPERFFAIQSNPVRTPRPGLALITLLPLIWLLAVTMTAGMEKIFHSDPRIGFLAQAKSLDGKWTGLQQAVEAAHANGTAAIIKATEEALRTNRLQHFNNILDAAVAGIFLALVAAIFLLSLREWVLLLSRRKLAVLRESQTVWLPEHISAQRHSLHLTGVVALMLSLAKELSIEAKMERRELVLTETCHDTMCFAHMAQGLQPEFAGTQHQQVKSTSSGKKNKAQIYLELTEHRFSGVTRCC
jgi:carbon starvation protein